MKRSPTFPTVILLLVLTFSSLACYKTRKVSIGEDSIPGLGSPVVLEGRSVKIVLQDYFPDPSIVDSVSVSPEVAVEFTKGSPNIQLSYDPSYLDPLYLMRVYTSAGLHSILLKRSRRRSVKLTFDPGEKEYKQVNLAGSLNDWNPAKTTMELVDGKWTTDLLLNPGEYQYQVVADGEWMLDPGNPDSADNNIGGFNSLLKVGEGESGEPLRISSDSEGKRSIVLRSSEKADKVIVLWEDHEVEVLHIGEGRYQVNIPDKAVSIGRSHLRGWAFLGDRISNDILIPLQNGKAVRSATDLSRNDRETNIMYFMLVDRFMNGDKANDDPLNDPDVHYNADYHGGDLAGIKQKIDDNYFEELGINALWVSPITQNPRVGFNEFPEPHRKYSGYHGYWPISSTKVDHRFGTNDEFRKLVNTAHDNGMNVYLDFVANHVHEDHPLIKQHPEWKTQLELPDGSLNIRIWEEQRLTTWFDTFLPSLDFSQNEVVEAQADSAMFWMEEFAVDGFRHDATKHIPESFWRSLTRKTKARASESGTSFYQIGETFGSRELIGSYIGSGQLDAQFDFNLYFDARSVFANDSESFEKLRSSLTQSLEHYGYHSLMGNITGNHDLPRFMFYAGGSARPGEDEKEAGWTRKVEVEDVNGYMKLSSLTAFLMTIPGIPIIYYGDEIGMTGAGDPDCRRDMRFTGWNANEQATYDRCKKLIELRKQQLPLLYGDLEILHSSKDQLAYIRTWFDEAVLVVMNRSDENSAVKFPTPERFNAVAFTPNFGGTFTSSGGEAAVELDAYSFEVLTSSK